MTPTLDHNGAPLKVGDTVRQVEFETLTHVVQLIGTEAPFAGYIMVTGKLGWAKSTRFQKVTGNGK